MLLLSRKIYDELVNHAISGAPFEICGIISGETSENDTRKAGKIYRMTNTDKSERTFLMDPKEQLKVMKGMRNNNEEMVAIYHSHPATRAYPSSTDVGMSFYPDTSFIIISLENKNKPYMKSYNIRDGKITEEEIKILSLRGATKRSDEAI